ncbi:hypothetical protein NEIPOLOT_00257 [Neisseria polysaccharea ATCC 43768]|nr:hypothetical protein NEIPOLOT_00257 [Neisseria polysaccharea ATCC 43768]
MADIPLSEIKSQNKPKHFLHEAGILSKIMPSESGKKADSRILRMFRRHLNRKPADSKNGFS